jgi:23S rRNA pseudouridine2605 synthase
LAERLQKFLAAAGIGSRRQIEAWVRAGRITINGEPATLGQPVDERDRISIDGRRLHLRGPGSAEPEVLMYHRSPGEALKPQTALAQPAGQAAPRATEERLPKLTGRRWVPLSPLAPIDGGLELFTTDGRLRAAAGRLAHRLPSVYSVRVRGPVDDGFLAALPPAASLAERPFRIASVEQGGGEGQNVWLLFTVEDARARDLRALLATEGLLVSRVLRVRFGPLALDRTLARGRHRLLEPEERGELYAALELEPARRARGAARARPRAGSRSARR